MTNKIKKTHQVIYKWAKYTLMAIVAFVFVLIASGTTSPMYPNYKGWDSGLFQVIGKGWLSGYVPYKELYDQKGPIIFFIDMLGYAITGNKYGVFVIQIFFSFLSILFIYKILRRVFKESIALIISLIMIFVFSCNYEFGNLCEEYANPLLIACFYFVSNWLIDKEEGRKEHNPLYALFYGITFGFCLMSRLTNAIGVCVAVLFIVIFLAYNKEFTNLLLNAISFLLGTAIMVVPFMIYFAIKDGTYDFWYGTLLYNIAYASNSKGGILTIIKGAPGQIGSYAIMAVGLLCLFRKRYFDGALYFALGAVTEFLLMNIMNYGHYSMITFAYLPVSIFEFKKLLNHKDDEALINKKVANMLTVMALLFVILVAGARTGKEMIKLMNSQKNYSANSNTDYVKAYNQLLDIVEAIPDGENDGIVGYGTNPWFYLDLDITPACRFFVMQDWQAEFSEDFKSKLLAEYEQKKPKWIVFSGSEEPGIRPILDKYYEEYSREKVINTETNDIIVVYKLK